jgi:hypothetical protein
MEEMRWRRRIQMAGPSCHRDSTAFRRQQQSETEMLRHRQIMIMINPKINNKTILCLTLRAKTNHTIFTLL